MDIKLPKGTKDILLAEAEAYEQVESALINVAKLFSYAAIRTPIFEHTELFTRSVGDGSDIVRKEMYTFIDKGDRSLSLRPEMTAGVIRSVVENKLDVTADLPLKLYYVGPAFRYERPQLGRFRQFHQFGVENIGITSPLSVAETISLGVTAFTVMGFKQVTVSINSLGDSATRDAYRTALKSFYEPHLSSVCPDCQQRFQTNPLRMLDCKVPADQALAKKAPEISAFLSEESKGYYSQVKAALQALNVEFKEDPQLVRGLDYYADCVFEFHMLSDKGLDYGALGAGGQYNNLVKELGGQPLKSVGFAFGLERLMAVLSDSGRLENVKPFTDIYIISMMPETDLYALKLSHNFRHTNFKTELNVEHKSMKASIKAALKKDAIYAVIIGDQEMKANQVTIKNLQTQEQQLVPVNEVVHLMQHLTNQPGHHHHEENEDHEDHGHGE
ncbi:MAG: histidine--tRNA ligase [Bacilli bacterium]